AIANWTKRAHFFTSLRSIQTSGSNPGTSPAKRLECRDASNEVMGPIPERPAHIPAHVAAVPTPSGDTSPIPVTTTRLRIRPRLTAASPAHASHGVYAGTAAIASDAAAGENDRRPMVRNAVPA